MNEWSRIEHVRLGATWVAAASRAELVAAAIDDALSTKPTQETRIVFDANGHGISLAARNARFRVALAQADIIHADGGFLVTASRWLSFRKIPERSATTDMIHDFAAACEEFDLSFYLLGGTEAVNAKASEILQTRYPRLRIVGRRNGYFSSQEEDSVVASISAAAPDFLWVGLGKPFEQEFCIRNRAKLDAKWAITCGGCYNYITGDYPRAPQWMQNANLEWLHRALTKPKQLLWRYATTTPHALAITALCSSRKRRKNGARDVSRSQVSRGK